MWFKISVNDMYTEVRMCNFMQGSASPYMGKLNTCQHILYTITGRQGANDRLAYTHLLIVNRIEAFGRGGQTIYVQLDGRRHIESLNCFWVALSGLLCLIKARWAGRHVRRWELRLQQFGAGEELKHLCAPSVCVSSY